MSETWTVEASQLSGEISIPPSKSHTMRALLFAAMAEGESHISNCLPSPDVERMREGLVQMGAKITATANGYQIKGVAGKPHAPKRPIDAGNSGQVLRFLGAVAALGQAATTITGDASIRTLRPVQPLLDGLRGLGAKAESVERQGYAPISIKGPIRPGRTALDGSDSQPVSGMLIAAGLMEGQSQIFVHAPGETPWIDMTLYWLAKMGVPVSHDNYKSFTVQGKPFNSFNYSVPADYSSAAFPLVAGLMTKSELTISSLDPKDVQGDKKIVDLLLQMGARLEYRGHQLCVGADAVLTGIEIDMNECIDALPIMAVLGTQVKGKMILRNAAIARKKESDRIHSMCLGLTAMGANVEEHADGMTIYPSKLKGAKVDSFNDHRIAMAFSVAGMIAAGKTVILGCECVEKSFPEYVKKMRGIGVRIEEG